MSSTSLKPLRLFVANPNPVRGSPLHLGYDPRTRRIAYTTGKLVVLRSVDDPMNAEVYSEHAYAPTCAKFSPSGNYMCSGDASGSVRIWALDNEDRTLQLEVRPLGGRVIDIAWSSDNQRIVVCGEGKEKFAHVFAVNTGSSIGEVSGHTATNLSVDFRPTRPFRIVSCGEDNSFNLHEGPPFKFVKACRQFTKFVNCARFSPDGSRFAVVGGDQQIYLFDGKTADPVEGVTFPKEHTGSVYSVSWSPDGTKLVTSSADKTVKVFDASTGALLHTFSFQEHSDAIKAMQMGVVFITNEAALSVGLGGDLSVINFMEPSQQPRAILGHKNPITNIALLENGASFVSSSIDGLLYFWNIEGGCLGRVQPAFTADSKKPQHHTNSVTGLAVQGGKILTCSMDDTVRVVDVESQTFEADRVCAITGSPSGLAQSARDPEVSIVISTRAIYVLKGMDILSELSVGYEPSAVAFDDESDIVAVGGKDNSLYVYRLQRSDGSLTETQKLSRHMGWVTSLAFNRDATLLASGDSNREVIVWDTKTWAPVVSRWVFHNSRVTCLSWSPSGRRLASGSLDRGILVWDVDQPSQAPLAVKNAHVEGVTAILFVNESTILSGGNDACLRSWSLS